MRCAPIRVLSTALLLLAMATVQAQDSLVVKGARDTATVKPDWRLNHKPGRAALYSALLPGAGQVYNRKYWKVPIVWGAIGASAYFAKENTAQYNRYTDAYVAIVDGDPSTVDEFNGAYSAESLLNTAETYRKWRDWSYIFLATSYILNIMDASIDANFVRFDVGRDLSMQVLPYAPLTARGSVGLSLLVSF